MYLSSAASESAGESLSLQGRDIAALRAGRNCRYATHKSAGSPGISVRIMIAGNGSMIIRYTAEKRHAREKGDHDDRQWEIIPRSEINLHGELLTSLPSDPDALYAKRPFAYSYMIYLRKITV